jgi:hypothetical protein
MRRAQAQAVLGSVVEVADGDVRHGTSDSNDCNAINAITASAPG